MKKVMSWGDKELTEEQSKYCKFNNELDSEKICNDNCQFWSTCTRRDNDNWLKYRFRDEQKE